MNRLLLHSAIHWEVDALIKHFQLKKNLNFNRLEVFENENITLVVSGIGKLRAACAVARVLQTFEAPENAAVINIGVAGSKPGHFDVGTLLRINSCIDASSTRAYYPELTLNLNLPESALETHERAVTKEKLELLSSPLVDMELAGVLEAASSFISWDRMYSLKVVSDLLEVGCLNQAFVNKLIEDQLPAITDSIAAIENYLDSQKPLLDSEKLSFVDEIGDRLKLSSSQSRILTDAVKGAEAKGIDWFDILESFKGRSPQSKQEASISLSEIRNALSVS